MDEPDSNLDAEGAVALARAVEDHKKRGGAAVIVAHRQGAFAQCDRVYAMEGGRPVPAREARAQSETGVVHIRRTDRLAKLSDGAGPGALADSRQASRESAS
jgi:ABC-type protease/lipase transport system fused ATPase/permease subunit